MTHGKLDWQDTDDYVEDAPVSFAVAAAAIEGTTGALNMRPWNGLLIATAPPDRAYRLRVRHYMRIGPGAFSFDEDFHVNGDTNLRLYVPAHGIEAEVILRKVDVAGVVAAEVLVSRTTRPTEHKVPVSAQPLAERAVTVASGVTDTANFNYPYAGPAVCSFWTNASAWTFILRGLDFAGTVFQWCRANNNVPLMMPFPIQVPPLACQARFVQSDGVDREWNIFVVPQW